MTLLDFQQFIQHMPYRNQAFDIKKANWKLASQQHLIDKIFNGNDTITINREDLVNAKWNIEEFVIKTLMWGYPTKGRGRNIENMLEADNFNALTNTLLEYRDREISIDRIKQDIASIKGLGLSTITKFTHFLDTTLEGNKAVILDIQIIEAINSGRYDELNHLKGIKYENGPNRYTEYLKTINDLSIELNAKPDQIEMFLFTFGRTLSPLKSTLQDRMDSGGAIEIKPGEEVSMTREEALRKLGLSD